MKNTISVATVLFIIFSVKTNAQSIQKQVLSSGGKKSTAGAYSINFTLGEMAVLKHSNASGAIAQGFQPYYILINTPLPVSWKEFQAKRVDEHRVDLNWVLSSEKNCRGFYVQRMQEGEKEFVDLSFVESKAEQGNSDIPTNYDYTDRGYRNVKTFYRIRQEDLDGKITYSETRVVNGLGKTDPSLDIWPIPANTTIHVMLNGLNEKSDLHILDMQGKIFRTIPIQEQNTIAITGLPPGMYIVQLANHIQLSQKIIIQ